MKQFRVEKDSLGEVSLPRNALWGAQTERARQNFPITGRTADPALLRAYFHVKRAAAAANRDTHALAEPLAHLIIEAVDELLALPETELRESFPVDVFQAGAGTSLHMNVNEVIANVGNRRHGKPLGTYQPLHPNDQVNRSQSTNDTYPTVMRLALLDTSALLMTALESLSSAFAEKGKDWHDIGKAGRTHLMDAVPIRLGEEFRAYGAALDTAAAWLEEARDALRDLGIGGSAAGSGLTVPCGYIPVVIEELSRLTDQDLRSAANLYQAMQSQAPIGRYMAHLRGIALELTRICNDLRLLASGPLTGFGELMLPAVQPGSSIMPGKVNPSILEMANQVCFAVIGHDQAVAMAVQAGQLELNVMMPSMASSALEATRILAVTLEILREKCVLGIQPNRARLQKHLQNTPQIATALSPKLGYESVATLVQDSATSGESVIELVRKRGLLDEKELQQLIDLDLLLGA